MKNLTYRIISAVIGLVCLFFCIYLAKENGVYFLAILVVLRGSFELARMLFIKEPGFSRWLLIFINLLTFLIITQENFKFLTPILIILNFIFVVTVAIILHRKFSGIDFVQSFILKMLLGLVYICLLPATVVWIVQTNNGIEWFLCLLAVVFSGDIGAFLFGSYFGKTKIAPELSPNKSLEGSLGGLFFSILVALSFKFFILNVPIYILFLCGLFGGLFGQIGDFFESLLKRISGVKDSGSIMPGHGGVLDRLDGILMAAPIFYIVSKYFSI